MSEVMSMETNKVLVDFAEKLLSVIEAEQGADGSIPIPRSAIVKIITDELDDWIGSTPFIDYMCDGCDKVSSDDDREPRINEGYL